MSNQIYKKDYFFILLVSAVTFLIINSIEKAAIVDVAAVGLALATGMASAAFFILLRQHQKEEAEKLEESKSTEK